MAEPGGVGGVGGIEGEGPLHSDLTGGPVVDRRCRVQADAGVAVHVVVVIEERSAERSGVFDGAEPAGERRAVLEGLEVRLALGVAPSVAASWPAFSVSTWPPIGRSARRHGVVGGEESVGSGDGPPYQAAAHDHAARRYASGQFGQGASGMDARAELRAERDRNNVRLSQLHEQLAQLLARKPARRPAAKRASPKKKATAGSR